VIRVLLVEDNPGWAKIVQEQLAGGDSPEFSVDLAVRLGTALELLGSETYDVVVADLTLPDSAGLGTFHSLHMRAPTLPIVILSALEDEQIALEAVQGGAEDYVVKGALDPGYLSRTVRYAVVRHGQRAPEPSAEPRTEAPREPDVGLPLILHIASPAEDRTLVEDILKREPVRLHQVASGEEGVFRAQVDRPAVILLDLQLADLEASHVLRTLKEDPQTRSIPVIVAVDYVSPRRLQELEEDGAAGHLSKPIDRMKLLDEIDRFLRT
jgi:CheY-like chemotaxis protein